MAFELEQRGDIRWLRSGLLSGEQAPPHAFGVRSGHRRIPPSPEALLEGLGRPETLPLRLRQVHGARVVWAEAPAAPPPEADGVVTDRADLAPVVQTADCLPVLLWSPQSRRVAAVHAGWRGLAAGVLEAAAGITAGPGGDRGEIRAAIGPAIGPCCYEIGPEVADRFEDRFLREGREHRPHLDLWSAAVASLESAGVSAQLVELAERCTSCHADRFPSYRRDGGTEERIFSLILVPGS